jgi:3-methyladenine DNA glycosylase AlkD
MTQEGFAMASLEEVLERLKARAKSDRLEGMARYGIAVNRRFGVKVPEMRGIARETGPGHQLALNLWKTGIAEARIVASMIDIPEEVTDEQMEEWVQGLDSWDVCDQVCMNLFRKTPLAWKKAMEWSKREEEFVRRAAFALIACLAWYDREAADEEFIGLIPAIKGGATDGRNYVKKAVSWALKNIGKRNLSLNCVAIKAAEEIQEIDARSARWIASDVVRDLTRESVQKRLREKKPRE